MNREELLKNARPILFNTEMVQAILEGRKTVTRRKIDRDITNFCDVEVDGTLLDYQNCHGDFINPIDLCRYKAGDILYVRETWSFISCDECKKSESHTDFNSTGCGISAEKKDYYKDNCGCYVYRTNYGTTEDDSFPPSMFKWRPSIHMPKAAARIFLKETDIRVERLQDITEEQAEKEGVKAYGQNNCSGTSARIAFAELWDSISETKFEWRANPWVWVIEFERVEVENE